MRMIPATCLLMLSGPLIPINVNGEEAAILLHSVPGDVGMCNESTPAQLPCAEVDISANLGPSTIYIIGISPSSWISGMSFGIEYAGAGQEGVDLFWDYLCSNGLSFPSENWPLPGSSVRMTFQNCASEERGNAFAGVLYVYAYSEDLFAIIPNANANLISPELSVLECGIDTWGTQRNLSFANRAAVRFSQSGEELGYNPCTGEGTPPPPPLPPYDPNPWPPPPPQIPLPDQNQSLFLHVQPGDLRHSGCAAAPQSADDVITSVPSPESPETYTVYLLSGSEVENGAITDQLAYVQFGYDVAVPEGSAGLDVMEYIATPGCEPALYWGTDDWPAPGSGIRISRESCTPDAILVLGFFRVEVSGPAALYLTGWPGENSPAYPDVHGVITVFRCAARGSSVLELLDAGRVGWVSVGGAGIGATTGGCNPLSGPCDSGAVPVLPSSWGKLKSRYLKS